MNVDDATCAAGAWCWESPLCCCCFLLYGSSNMQKSTYGSAVAKGMDYDNKIYLQNHHPCMLCGYGTGSFTYFSFAGWHNSKLFSRRHWRDIAGGKCFSSGYSVLSAGSVLLGSVNTFSSGWLLHCTVVSSCRQFLAPTSVDFSVEALQQNTSQ